ncbi:hypothetical protein [Streptomyces avermitilis]|uniref:hypothetical protein n=1 Tax=Streptomyces avermitilis TaxID=33903 RepID=UPI00371BEA2E
MTDTTPTKKRGAREAARADREPPARDATAAPATPEEAPSHADVPGTPAPTPASESESVQVASGPVWFRPIGRHRKPRPRKVLFAVGGLALAAGALSFVRLAPESVGGGPGTAEAAPRIEATGDTADNAAAAVGATSSGRAGSPGGHSATAATGGASATPTSPVGSGHAATSPSGVALLPAAPGSVSTAPGHRGAPTARTPQPNPAPTDATTPAQTEATTPAAPRPAPSATTHTPHPPGLCVPLVGLCVNGAAAPAR